MTSPTKLTDIDPQTIFEYFNVSDIIEIHKKLQDEIEKKKEELRTMVGERYRDLIMAADTIGEMKSTSHKVGNHIENIIESCVNLNDQQLIGFKTLDEEKYQRKTTTTNHLLDNNKYFSIIIQIKLLTILPELIWTSIDDEDFFIAAQYFIFSRHVSTGLQLEHNCEILKTLPVAKKQWDTLSSFFFTIKRSCHETLEREDLTPDVAVKCLASLMLLENCQLDRALSTLIQFRGKAFLNSLSDIAQSSGSNQSQYIKVKDRILISLKILNETIILIYKCFTENGGQLIQLLSSIEQEKSLLIYEFLQSEFEPEVLKFLPDIITNFRPIVNLGDLKTEIIQDSMKSWMHNIESVAKNQLKAIIDLITSVKTIHDIRNRALAEKRPKNWDEICKSLHLPGNLDLYKFCYQPLIIDCVKTIIKNSWETSLIQIFTDVENLLKENEKNVKLFKKYIWTEEDEDIPKSLKEALNSSKQSHKLLMKTKGYVPSIVNLCNTMDKRLDDLYKDFHLYLTNSDDVNVRMRKSKDEAKEDDDMITFFKDCSRNGISNLITKIKQIDLNDTSINYILLARVLEAICELCPNLKICLSFNLITTSTNWSTTSSDGEINTNQIDFWDRMCALLEEESLRFWQLWVDSYIIETTILNDDVDLNVLLREFPNWEIQTIEEKDEQENAIESTIRIPSQPSFFLQQYLHFVCCDLNQLVPHTLPKTVIQQLTEKILQNLIDYYNKLSENEFVQKNQNTALQYFFDIKFLNLILVSRENKKITESIQILGNRFKTFIDPFDFELFFKYLNGNVKKSGIRMQHQLGCLVSNNEQLSTLLGGITNVTTPGQEKEPNILALSSTANTSAWFPLLPIANNNSNNATGLNSSVSMSTLDTVDKLPSIKSSVKPLKTSASTSSLSSATQNYASNVKSGAAAFFGAMSQEWFRSN